MFDYRNTPHKRLERLVWESDRDFNKEWASDELYAIEFLDLSSQFLEAAEKKGFKNPGQSTVLYASGGTDEAPTSYPKTLKIHSGRVSPPDIDIDIDDRKRDVLIDYSRERYGSEKVAHIGTFARVKAKSAIRDAARALGYEYSKADEISKLVPEAVLGITKNLSDSLASSKEMHKAYTSDTDTRKIIDEAIGLEGLVRSWGMHAAGVVIAKSDVTDFIPVMRRKEGDPVVTQWDMHRVEEAGQLKIDFLGLRNLGVLDMTLDYIREARGIDLDLDDIPLDDEMTFQRFCEGDSVGCFQIESPGMRRIMLGLQPNRIEDIMALISLFRPGPLGSGMDKLFIDRKHGRSDAKSYHPVLDELLSKTYGVMLYQEDVLAVARSLAGFSAVEADNLRKAIGKKQMDKIGMFRDMFVQGCKDQHNVNPDLANKIYSDIEYFGGYGFNLAHAASYAMVSYLTGYFKFNYPTEYMAALLTSIDTKEKAAPYLNECRRLGILVSPPSINRSDAEYKVQSEDEILVGLSSVAGIGPAIVSAILSGRDENEYYSLDDFMRRCDESVLNKATLEHLARAGAFDDLVPEQPMTTLSREQKSEVLDLERAELGLFLTEHPLTGIWHILEPDVTANIVDLEDEPDGSKVTLGGILSKVQKKTTKRGQLMYILTLEDLTANIEILVFPKVAENHEFSVGEIVLLEGQLVHEGDEEHAVSKIFFDSMHVPDVPDYGTGQPILLSSKHVPREGLLLDLEDIIQEYPGDSVVYFSFVDNGVKITLKFNRPASLDAQPELEALL